MTTPPPAQTALAPWTRGELMSALRAAGWQRMTGPAAVYNSPHGVRFNLDEYRAPIGVLWRHYALRRELPEGRPPRDGRLPRYDTPPRPRGRPPGSHNHNPRPLGDTSLAVLSFTRRYKAEHDGLAPSLREINDALGLGSTSVVAHHLNRLETHGLIRRAPGRPRWIEIIEQTEEAPAA